MTDPLVDKLKRLGRLRQQWGKEHMAVQPKQIPHLGADPRLADAARILVECMYVDGDFGDGERDESWIMAKALDLAEILQGAYEDWSLEAVKP